MKILVVNSFFPPRTTGSAHFTLDVVREYVRAGHEVTVLTTSVDGAAATETLHGAQVIRVPAASVVPGNLAFNYALPFVVRPGVMRRIREVFDQFQPDVVHQNGQFFDLTMLTTWVAWRRRVPRVLTVHTPLVHTNRYLRALISAVDRTAIRLVNAPGAPVVVGVDRFVCELSQRRLRPTRGPVRFIPATLQVDAFGTGDGARVRDELGIGDAPLVLSFGHVIPIRNRVPLIRALPALIREFPRLRVLVVGEVYDDEFQRVADELGVSDHVISVGRIEHREVPDYLAAATLESHDLGIHGLGITTLEVMAAHVPVFAAVRRDVFPGIDLDDWPDLHIVDLPDPESVATGIAELLRSSELRERAVEAQFRFVSTYFRSEAVAAQYLSIFEELTSRVGGR